MKKLMLSCTLTCLSLFGKKGIVDAYNNIPTKPQNHNNLHNVPLATNTINTTTTAASQSTEVPSLPTDSLAPIQTPAINNLFSISTIEQTIEKLNPLNLVPLNNNDNTLAVADNITNVPNILAESPVLVVTNTLPVDHSVIENVIAELLDKKTKGTVVCYKIITNVDKQTQYVFAPSAAYKNPVKNIYQSIAELVTLLVGKLQELFCNNNTLEIDTDNLTDALENFSETQEQ